MKKNENNKKQVKSMVNAFKYIWHYLKFYKFQFVFVVVACILISFLISGIIIGQYYFMQAMTSILKEQFKPVWTNEIILYSIFLLLAVTIMITLNVLQTITMNKVAQFTGRSIRKDLYFKILQLKLSFFDQNPSGDIMSRLTNDVNNITNALAQNVTQFIVNASQIVIMLFTMIMFSPILGLVSLVFFPIQIGVILLLFKKSQPNFIKKQTALGDINGFIEETISGQKVINNFNKQQPTIEKFQQKNQIIRKIDYSTQTLSNFTGPWNTFAGSMLTFTLFLLSITFSSINYEFGGIVSTTEAGKTKPENIISLLTIILILSKNYTNPIYQIFQMLYLLQGAMAGTERAFFILNQEVENKEMESETIEDIKGNVEFKNLSFSYDEGGKVILKNINLKIKPGQVVGIVGPTGSGKTTIINLLTKFYDIINEDSDILIDGKSIKTMTKESLRNEVSIVLQDTFIFENTIFENLRLSKKDATNEEIIEAAKKANAHNFIMQLENGYETILENNADELSQGEKQLLAIARAFLKRSSILILDEATSSIDTKTEKDIQAGMIELSKGKTTFMIAHRLSTIKHADIIIVLKDGEILEQGNHEELLALKGFYATMYNSKLNTPEDV